MSAPWWWPSPPTSTSASTAPPSSSTPALSSAETSAGCSASGNTTLKVSNKISREYIQRRSLILLSLLSNCLSVKVLWTQFLGERPCLNRFSEYCVRRSFVDTFIHKHTGHKTGLIIMSGLHPRPRWPPSSQALGLGHGLWCLASQANSKLRFSTCQFMSLPWSHVSCYIRTLKLVVL